VVTLPGPEILLHQDTLQLADSIGVRDSVADLVGLVSQLRKEGHPPERIHHAIEQARLRRRAHPKLGPFANRMLFTEAGLEQATRLQVAAHHAGRFQSAGMDHVADIGCGLGVDSMAMAALGIRVTAVERDELTAALATYNLAPFDTAQVIHGDGLTLHASNALANAEGYWLDPARRDASKRLPDPDDWSPSLNDAFRLAEQKPSGIKLAPGIDRDLLPPGAEWQWVSVDSDVVEVVVWTGALARPGVGRSALVLRGDNTHDMTAPADSPDAPVGALGDYLYEPDGAVIRARLIGDLARRLGGRMVSPTIAYITTDTPQHTPFASGFQIHRVLPFKLPELKKWVREEGIGVVEIKKRGVDVDPAGLRKKLPLGGDNQATLIITRVGEKRVALVTSRLDPVAAQGSVTPGENP
jgi:hypothetical protein